MTKLDVSHLKNESLPSAPFPVQAATDFRVFFDSAAHAGMVAHAKEDKSVEICGVVVGKWQQDDDGPYARVTEYIRCDDATNKFAEVTFTHESWTHINSEMDTKYPELSIVGWYHSHPDFGIFLSDRDMFIQENFFSGPGQFAFVVDPVRDTEGLFEWRNNKAELKQHYWIGSKIRTSQASQDVPKVSSAKQDVSANESGVSQTPLFASGGFSPISAILLCLCLFLLGYLLANWSNRWQQESIVEGAVAHFGVYKLMHLGLEEPLSGARELASSVDAKSADLLKAHLASLNKDQKAAALKKYGELGREIKAMRALLDTINQRHALTLSEQQTLAQVAAIKLKELRDPPREAKASQTDEKKSNNKAKTSTKTKQKATPQ